MGKDWSTVSASYGVSQPASAPRNSKAGATGIRFRSTSWPSWKAMPAEL